MKDVTIEVKSILSHLNAVEFPETFDYLMSLQGEDGAVMTAPPLS